MKGGTHVLGYPYDQVTSCYVPHMIRWPGAMLPIWSGDQVLCRCYVTHMIRWPGAMLHTWSGDQVLCYTHDQVTWYVTHMIRWPGAMLHIWSGNQVPHYSHDQVTRAGASPWWWVSGQQASVVAAHWCWPDADMGETRHRPLVSWGIGIARD